MGEAAEEASAFGGRELDRQQDRTAVLAADADALEDCAAPTSRIGAQHPDLACVDGSADQGRAGAHDDQRPDQHRLPADPVPEVAEDQRRRRAGRGSRTAKVPNAANCAAGPSRPLIEQLVEDQPGGRAVESKKSYHSMVATAAEAVATRRGLEAGWVTEVLLHVRVRQSPSSSTEEAVESHPVGRPSAGRHAACPPPPRPTRRPCATVPRPTCGRWWAATTWSLLRRPVGGDLRARGRQAPGPGRAAHRLGQVRGLLRGHPAAARARAPARRSSSRRCSR